MCHIPSPNRLVFCSHKSLLFKGSRDTARITAVRENDGNRVWETPQEINWGVWEPWGLVYLPQVDLVLVGDLMNNRLVFLSPRSGVAVQTINLKHIGPHLKELHVKDQRLMVRHNDAEGRVKLSFYSVSHAFSFNKRGFF